MSRRLAQQRTTFNGRCTVRQYRLFGSANTMSIHIVHTRIDIIRIAAISPVAKRLAFSSRSFRPTSITFRLRLF